jgi:hypothetical protein
MTKRRRRRARRTNLGEPTKAEFIAIAKILCTEHASPSLSRRFAEYFGSQNPRFDEARFLKATQSCSR